MSDDDIRSRTDLLGMTLDRALEAERQELADALIELMLAGDHQITRAAVGSRLEGLGERRTPSTMIALVKACSRRPLPEWPQWLADVPDEAFTQAQGAPQASESLVRSFWSAITREPIDEHVTDAALDAVVKLNWGYTREQQASFAQEFGSAVSAGAPDETSLEVRLRQVTALLSLSENAILQLNDIAGPVLDGMVATAQLSLPQQVSNSSFCLYLLDWISVFAPHADTEKLAQVAEAVSNSPWLPSPDREVLRIEVGASIRTKDPDHPPPLTTEELETLYSQYGESFGRGLAAWISGFNPSLGDFWRVIRAFVGAPTLPADLNEAMRGYTGQLSRENRLWLVSQATETGQPSQAFLQAVRFSDADPQGVAELIIKKGRSPDGIEEAFRLWLEFGPLDDAIRRRLIIELYVPTVEQGRAGVDLAIDRADLVTNPPHGTKERIRAAFRQNAEPDQYKRVEDRLIAANLYKRRRRGLFGTRVEPVEDEGGNG